MLKLLFLRRNDADFQHIKSLYWDGLHRFHYTPNTQTHQPADVNDSTAHHLSGWLKGAVGGNRITCSHKVKSPGKWGEKKQKTNLSTV